MKVLWLLELTAQLKFQFYFEKRKGTWDLRWPTHVRGGHTGLCGHFPSAEVAAARMQGEGRGSLARRVAHGQESSWQTLRGNRSCASEPDHDVPATKGPFLPDLGYDLCVWGIRHWVLSWELMHVPSTPARPAHTSTRIHAHTHTHMHAKEIKVLYIYIFFKLWCITGAKELFSLRFIYYILFLIQITCGSGGAPQFFFCLF